MKIHSLYLKNFAPIYYALDKYEVNLEFVKPNDKVINIIIGKMGSCKTFILGHLQPFATLGSLDVRNQDDMILEGKTGIKEITILDGIDTYFIKHVYFPSKSSHNIKSYIKKNDMELNENGNVTSFKSTIEVEFGIDQSMLKLFRIGQNVTNLMDMKSTERKAFVSSMLYETSIYNLLYKKIGDDYRSISAQSVVLANKMKTITSKSADQLQQDLDESLEFVSNLQEQIEDTTKRVYQLEASIHSILNGMDFKDYKALVKEKYESRGSLIGEINELEEKCKAIKNYPDTKELDRILGGLEAKKSQYEYDLIRLEGEIQKAESKLSQLNDRKKIIGSIDHIETLRITYAELCSQQKEYEKTLQYFKYTGSRASIENLIADAQAITDIITDVSQYKPEAISHILRNPTNAIAYSKKRIDILEAKKEKLQKQIGNIKYTEEYQPTDVLYRPFGCPTDKCPYFVHHPYTEKMRNIKNAVNVDKEFMKLRNEISKIDAELYLMADYPYLSSKLSMLHTNWKRIIPIMKELDALNEDNLLDVITNLMKRNWYDAPKLQKLRELCGIREKYYELTEHIASMKNEISQYELSDIDKLLYEIEKASEEYKDLVAQLEDTEICLKHTDEDLEKYNDIYLTLANLETIAEAIHERKLDLVNVDKEIEKMNENIEIIQSQLQSIGELKDTITRLKNEHHIYMNSADATRSTLNDLKLTTDQYEDVLHDQEIMKDIINAVSSKKGIPLAFVKLFLMDSKNILNDLISDVFANNIEIQDFDIPEDGTEFNIPYTKNGNLIKDIEKASQGEKAIISLALSFALIRQRTFRYNIMILDEVDGALYKNDRNKFIAILFKQIKAINAEQVFLISHNNTFDGYDVNIIMTTDEVVDDNPLISIMRI